MTSTTDMSGPARNPAEDARAIGRLMDQLRDRDGLQRQAARLELVELGAIAVPALTEALRDPSEQVRWEAAKALTELPDARAAENLAELLRDVDSIRWLAGTALIQIGEPAFVPILRVILAHPGNPRVREGARRVLHELKRQNPDHPHIQTMLDALQGPAQAETLPWVARGILKKMGLVLPDESAP